MNAPANDRPTGARETVTGSQLTLNYRSANERNEVFDRRNQLMSGALFTSAGTCLVAFYWIAKNTYLYKGPGPHLHPPLYIAGPLTATLAVVAIFVAVAVNKYRRWQSIAFLRGMLIGVAIGVFMGAYCGYRLGSLRWMVWLFGHL